MCLLSNPMFFNLGETRNKRIFYRQVKKMEYTKRTIKHITPCFARG